MKQFGHDVDRGMTMGGARVILLGAMREGSAKGRAWGADITQTSRAQSLWEARWEGKARARGRGEQLPPARIAHAHPNYSMVKIEWGQVRGLVLVSLELSPYILI